MEQSQQSKREFNEAQVQTLQRGGSERRLRDIQLPGSKLRRIKGGPHDKNQGVAAT